METCVVQMGSEEVGSEEVGSEEVSSEEVGSEEVGSEEGRSRSCSLPPLDDAKSSTEIFVPENREETNPFSYCRGACCIYRVPPDQRRINPELYIPQLVLIGPLHHAKKEQARRLMQNDLYTDADSENLKYRYKLYADMERQKKIYCQVLFGRCRQSEEAKNQCHSWIKDQEEEIRRCYAESTLWIKTDDFVDLVFHDALFIIEFIMRLNDLSAGYHVGDLVIELPGFRKKVWNDLVLLENQLPYFIIRRLYDILKAFSNPPFRKSFRQLIGGLFPVRNSHNEDVFKHFTDILRCSKIGSLWESDEGAPTLEGRCGGFIDILPPRQKASSRSSSGFSAPPEGKPLLQCPYNVENLANAGVKFVVNENDDSSVKVVFEGTTLKMSQMKVENSTELELRNIIALEQCHYTDKKHVCDYVALLDSLIDTENDVGILRDNKILVNLLGSDRLVADMVNRLTHGIMIGESHYAEQIKGLEAHYNKSWNHLRATLRNNYFSNLWRGTGTLAAAFLLLFTVLQAITSIIQLMK